MIWFPTPIYKFLPYLYIIGGIGCFSLGFSGDTFAAKLLFSISGGALLLAGSKVAHWRWKSQHY